MSYIVFARKYRPQTFDEIVGQSHITTTLKNAISQDRVAHAYIFAGPRGVGKTTAARILAKALNCDKGPTPKPCNSCVSCKEIVQGTSLDVLEIDGASNRGIDEIRNLRDNVKFAPSKGRFKAYIIDEVHMLTPEAFNALLKTLEEPPPHVKFIFATTQAHKVPATILSRCQRFDFRRISTKDIAESLMNIRKAEGLNIDDEAINLIAKYSDGAMRNGQVVLDQIVSFAKGKIGPDDVSRILGIVDDEALFGFSEAIREKDAKKALVLIDRLANDGKDITQIVLGLIEHFRNISVAKVGSDKDALIDAGADKIKRYKIESEHFTIEDILYVIYTLSNTIDFMRKSGIPRIPFEGAMIKLTRCGSILSLNEILKRLDGLEKSAESENNPAPSGNPSRHSSPAPLNSPDPINNQTVGPSDKTQVKPVEKHAASNMEEILSSWNAVIDHIKNKKISIASYLQEGYPLSLEAGTLAIGFPKDLNFHKETLETPDNKRLIEESANIVLKSNIKIRFELVEPSNMKKSNGAGYPRNVSDEAFGSPSSEDDKGADPVIKAALEMFGGSITGKGESK